MRTFFSWLIPSTLLFTLALAPAVRADDKDSTGNNVDAQYHSLADARTNADLALRKAREFFDKTDGEWRSVSGALDQARGRIGDQIQKDVQLEQRKPDETRDNDKINSLNDRNHQIDIDWTKFANIDRPALEQRYNVAKGVIQQLSQIYNDLANQEPGWKDSKLDLSSLQASFDAITKRSGEVLDAAQKALDELKEQDKTWESMPEIVAAPAAAPAKQ